MALGNANTSAQARGRNEAIVVKRRKQIVLAQDYQGLSRSSVQQGDACRVRGLSVGGDTFFYNRTSGLVSENDVAYLIKRADPTQFLPAGYYMIEFESSNFNMRIGENGIVINNPPDAAC